MDIEISAFEVAISSLLGVAIYYAMILALKGFGKNELSLVKDLLSGFNMKRD